MLEAGKQLVEEKAVWLLPLLSDEGQAAALSLPAVFRGTLKMSGRLCWTAWATPIKTSAANSTTPDWEWEISYWPHPAGCN